MQKRWLVKTPSDSTVVEELGSKLKVDDIIATLLVQRGIRSYEDAERFFRPKLIELHDPFLMKDMSEAVERVEEAIESEERVMLFGDYDVDGTTAVALLYSYLKDTLPIDFYIPDRYTEGYGLSKQGIDVAEMNGVSLIITLDCGIKSIEEVEYARSKGIDMIVCDHHTPGEEIPNAIVLNPKRKDCEYPFEELSGCGVGFKLMQALAEKMSWSEDRLFELLDFVAISIGADIVPVIGENRILAYHGMEVLNRDQRPAFKEMIAIAGKQFPLTLTDVVFTIAPRINAVGRLRSGRTAVELMVSDDDSIIKALAHELNDDNMERRELDKSMTQEALKMLDADPGTKSKWSTVVYSPDWHKGVVGIVASRLIEKHYKPTIVLTESNGLITGSARSVQGFDIHDALSDCIDLLEKFGGHTHAAGLSLLPENLEEFIQRFERIVRERLQPELRVEEQEIDFELAFDQIYMPNDNRMKVPRLKRILSQFEPHGPGNMKPVFVSKNVFSRDVRLLKEEHLKLSMIQPNNDVVLEGIGFSMPDKMDNVAHGIPYDVVYTLEVNRWNDRETLQLNIKDLREVV